MVISDTLPLPFVVIHGHFMNPPPPLSDHVVYECPQIRSGILKVGFVEKYGLNRFQESFWVRLKTYKSICNSRKVPQFKLQFINAPHWIVEQVFRNLSSPTSLIRIKLMEKINFIKKVCIFVEHVIFFSIVLYTQGLEIPFT